MKTKKKIFGSIKLMPIGKEGKEIYSSLSRVQNGMYHNKKRIKMAPKGEEPDLHFPIRMNLKAITTAYKRS